MLQITRLQARLVMLVSLASLLFACLAGGVVYWMASGRVQAQSLQTIEHLCGTVAKTASIAAYVGNRDVAQDVVNGLLNNETVLSVELTGSTDGMQVRRSKSADGAQVQADQVTCALYSPFDESEQVGSLLIEPDERVVMANARAEALRQVLFLVVQIWVMSCVLIMLVGEYLSRPIGRLAAQLRELAPGGPQRLAMPQRHQHDEIGELVRSSNQLLEATEAAFLKERRLRADVEAMEQQYRHIFDSTSAGIVVLDANGHLINANPTMMRLMGVRVDGHRDYAGISFLHGAFVDPARAWELVHLAQHSGQTEADDLELRCADGRTRWVHGLVSVQSEEGRIRLIEVVMYDITERKRKERETLHQAEHDVLTGLKNRRGAELFVEDALRKARLESGAVALMLIDLDGFKAINDQYGHAAGDEVLVAVALRLRKSIRQGSDTVARLGGDEFLVVIGDAAAGRDQLSNIAEGLLTRIASPITLPEGREVSVGGSLGIACFPQDGSNYSSLLKAADGAMYQVKRAGKHGFGFAARGQGGSGADATESPANRGDTRQR